MRLPYTVVTGIGACAIVAALVTAVLLLKSLKDFSRTGPQLRVEILSHYRLYATYALLRLGAWTFAIAFALAGVGVFLLDAAMELTRGKPSIAWQVAAGAASLGLITGLQFLLIMHRSPATIVASSQYNLARFRRLLVLLSPARLRAVVWVLSVGALLLSGAALEVMLERSQWLHAFLLAGVGAGALALWWFGIREREPRPVSAAPGADARPNILMIGSDTLRADRLGANGYYRSLTPRIDSLARKGTLFTHCFVPCARTAPSLISLLSGCWPHHHGIRDNYVADDETHLSVPLLPKLLRDAGYETAAVGDWAASDFSKFDFGFDRVHAPPDQWNIKYLLRQGPKDLRLFLSLFTGNAFGRRALPEIYFLAGVPRTRQVGIHARREISRMAAAQRPFMLTVFTAATHPPFGSEYPYYTMFADPNYGGDSVYAMSRLTDPFDVIRRQGQAREEFDLDQIEDLYDGCVRSFDDEVAKTLTHLERCGLADNTIVVVFSDHGMEFFEHDTWGQGNSVFGDQSAQTPLLIYDPRSTTGRTFPQVIRSIDLAPTLLDLTRVARPAAMDGVTLVQSVNSGAEPPPLLARNETGIWLTDLPGMPAGHLRYPSLPEILHVPDRNTGTLAVRPDYRERIVSAKDRMIRSASMKITFQPMTDANVVRLSHASSGEELNAKVAQSDPEIHALYGDLSAWLAQDGQVDPTVVTKSQRLT